MTSEYGRIDEMKSRLTMCKARYGISDRRKFLATTFTACCLRFDQVYEAASEVERKEFMRAFIERIELFPEKQLDGNWIRKIIFNFPVPVNGTEVKELPLENETMVETVVLLSKLQQK